MSPNPEPDKPSKVEQHRKEFVEKALGLMKNGKMFWQRPWDVSGIAPVNAVSQRAYKGCNIAYLLYAATVNNYSDPRWVTYKQAQENGWQVRKGEHGSKIEFWSVIGKGDDDAEAQTGDIEPEGREKRLYCKIYTVFNAAQVDGIPPMEAKGDSKDSKKDFQPHEKSERIMDNCGVPISYGGGEACYISALDVIQLPDRGRFFDEAHFYATALHEIAHSTGHPDRLNRDLAGGMRSPSYAKEELRAEMASAFMQMELGFSLTAEGMEGHIEKHAAYLQSWLSHLKEDYKEFFRATQDAVKISDYVLDYDRERTTVKTLENGTMPTAARQMAAARSPRMPNGRQK
jgi:antirestriction protein ArdC